MSAASYTTSRDLTRSSSRRQKAPTSPMSSWVYPRLFRALLGVEHALKEQPEEASLAADIDLTPIRSVVAVLLRSEDVRST